MIIKRVGPMSCAKVTGALYGIIGFVLGCVFAVFALVGGVASNKTDAAIFGLLFGAGAFVVLPIIYGGIGFLMTLLMAALYNVMAGWVGGVEIQLEPGTGEPGVPPRA